MYNLFVSGNVDTWDGEPWIVDIGRCIRDHEYTDTLIAERFGKLDAAAVNELKRLPCIFAYERQLDKSPKFGVLREITMRQGQARIDYEIKDVVPFLSVESISDLTFELDIRKYELNRTHWAVKDVNLAKELNRLGVNLPAWACGPTELVDITTHVFDAALSFPGEVREVVEQVALELGHLNGHNSCFYDNNYRPQLARPALDLLLQDIYRNRAKLVVVFLGGDYQRKDWCGVEFRAIREILMVRDHKKIMFVRMDDAPVDGVFRTDGYIDGRKFTPTEIAHFINERIALHIREESMTIHDKLAAERPLVYAGEVSRPVGTCSVVAAANDFELPPLLARYGEWVICENGIHCLYTPYFIDKDRLYEDDWIEHVTEKSWVVRSDFIAAFQHAKEIIGEGNGRDQVVFSGQDLSAVDNTTESQKESEQQDIVKVFPESTVFFYDRFCSAFPGVRGIQWFTNQEEAITRLSKMLRPPLSLTKDKHSGTFNPIWWWRGGDLHIRKFDKIEDGIALLDWSELKIDKVAAVNSGSYYQCFVYVQTSSMEPTGLYPRTEDEIQRCVDAFGYCSEEYGLFDKQLKVTRAEYDDGAAMVNGELIDFEGNTELRIRHITPYNFIIAAQNSPINNSKFDQTLKQLMNNILQGASSLEKVEEIISQLPKREPRG